MKTPEKHANSGNNPLELQLINEMFAYLSSLEFSLNQISALSGRLSNKEINRDFREMQHKARQLRELINKEKGQALRLIPIPKTNAPIEPKCLIGDPREVRF